MIIYVAWPECSVRTSLEKVIASLNYLILLCAKSHFIFGISRTKNDQIPQTGFAETSVKFYSITDIAAKILYPAAVVTLSISIFSISLRTV